MRELWQRYRAMQRAEQERVWRETWEAEQVATLHARGIVEERTPEATAFTRGFGCAQVSWAAPLCHVHNLQGPLIELVAWSAAPELVTCEQCYSALNALFSLRMSTHRTLPCTDVEHRAIREHQKQREVSDAWHDQLRITVWAPASGTRIIYGGHVEVI